MRLKLVYFVFFLIILLISIAALYFIRKYYLSNNLLRLDPLEDGSIRRDMLITRDDTTNIWLLGDSRIARWDDKLLSPLGSNIVNLGIEGQTTSQVLHRLRIYSETGIPQWLILEAGINDLKIIGLNKDLSARLTEQCFKNISEIAELCIKKDINLIIINIFPTGKIELLRRIVWNSSVEPAIIEANRKIKDYCNKNEILFFDTYPFICNDNFKIKEQYQNGFLHLNDKAYKVLSENLIKGFGTVINSGFITK